MITSRPARCQETNTHMRYAITAVLGATLALCAIGAKGKEADCSVARDPRRCEAQLIAREACGGLQGQARSACMREALPPPDCSRAPNTVECQSKQRAAQACKDKHGTAKRKCVRENASGAY